MHNFPTLLAYFGQEVHSPAFSSIAALSGLLLTIGSARIRVFKRWLGAYDRSLARESVGTIFLRVAARLRLDRGSGFSTRFQMATAHAQHIVKLCKPRWR
jgi:hypothetical protein